MNDSSSNVSASAPGLSLLVRQIRMEANGINSYELVDPSGAELPPTTAGAHIDLHLPGGITRQYSLCNDPAERHRYVIAVLRDEAGRGGSRAVHDQLHVRDIVAASLPRNNFPLVTEGKKYILLAGGIGVTPLKSMVHALEHLGKDYELHYCAKGPEFVAFREVFEPLVQAGRVVFHFDGANPAERLDIGTLLQTYTPGTHLYYCGPGGFMSACRNATAHWPEGSFHYEHFKVPEPARPGASSMESCTESADSFRVQIAGRNDMFEVPRTKSIVEVLEENGVPITTSCQSGLCGSCKVRYLSGEVDHQDFILSDEEHQAYMTPCVSRCNSQLLVIDL